MTIVLMIAGCASIGRSVVRAPLEEEGELVIALEPVAQKRGITADLVSVAAVHGGNGIPLELLAPRIAAEPVPTQRILARGRLAPGAYRGVTLVLKGSTPLPVHVEVPFQISRRRATLLLLSAQLVVPGAEEDEEKPRLPSFTAVVAVRPPPQVFGFCSSGARSELAGFDKDRHEVGIVLPTGRSPWGVAVDARANRAYVALADEDQIVVNDTGTGAEQTRIRLTIGDQPREIGLTPDGRTLIVANAGSNTASFVDTASMAEAARVNVGVGPTSVLVDRRGERAYVFNTGSNSFTALDVANRRVIATVGTDQQPLRGQVDRSGTRLYVAYAHSATMSVYSLADLSVQKRVHIGLGTSGIKVDPATDLLFVAKSGEPLLLVYDPLALVPIDRVEAAEGAASFAIDDAQNTLFALSPESNTVSVVQLASRKLVARFQVGEDARVVALGGERN